MKFKDDEGREFTVKNTPVIDDDLVRRLMEHIAPIFLGTDEELRTALTRAIAPPKDSITEAMLVAGNKAWNETAGLKGPTYERLSPGTSKIIRAIYAAMREAEEAAKPKPLPIDMGGHKPGCEAAQMYLNPTPGGVYQCTCGKGLP